MSDAGRPTRIRQIIASKIARGAAWSLAGTLVSRGLALIAAAAVARFVGKPSFGELGIIQSTLGMFQSFAGLGLGLTATKYVAQLRHTDPPRAGRIIALTHGTAIATGTAMALLVLGLSPWLAASVLSAPQVSHGLRPGALMLVFGVIAGTQTGTLAGFEAFRSIAWINVVTGIATFPLMVLGAWAGGVAGAVLGSGAALGLTCACNAMALSRLAREHGISIRYAACTSELGVLRSFSLPATIASLMVAPATWVTNAMLVNTHGGYAEMGVFNASNQWRMAVIYVPTALTTALLPALSVLAGQGNWPEYIRILRTNIVVVVLITIAVATPVAIGAHLVMLGYGDDFVTGKVVLVVLMIATVVAAIPSVVGQAIISLDRMWAGALLNGVWGVALVISASQLVDRGAFGLALGYLIAYGVHLVTSTTYAYWQLVRRGRL
jgi:O-antigen/teichoic acid export membrane protein